MFSHMRTTRNCHVCVCTCVSFFFFISYLTFIWVMDRFFYSLWVTALVSHRYLSQLLSLDITRKHIHEKNKNFAICAKTFQIKWQDFNVFPLNICFWIICSSITDNMFHFFFHHTHLNCGDERKTLTYQK